MPIIAAMTMGDVIRRARKAHGLTTLELSLRLGVGSSTVARLEGDDYSSLPKPDLLTGISEVLDIPIGLLIESFGYRIGEDSPALRCRCVAACASRCRLVPETKEAALAVHPCGRIRPRCERPAH